MFVQSPPGCWTGSWTPLKLAQTLGDVEVGFMKTWRGPGEFCEIFGRSLRGSWRVWNGSPWSWKHLERVLGMVLREVFVTF